MNLRPSARIKITAAAGGQSSSTENWSSDRKLERSKISRLINSIRQQWAILPCILITTLVFSWILYKGSVQGKGKNNSFFVHRNMENNNFQALEKNKSIRKSKEQQEIKAFPLPPEFDSDGTTRMHVVFSTDCSAYQHWQSYALFYSAMKVRQPGKVTRIASGCSDIEAIAAKRWHQDHIQRKMSPNFKLHLTPDFSAVNTPDRDSKRSEKYSYFNKPFGLLHWMQHGEDMGVDPETNKLLDEDSVIILVDPDMLLLRPFSVDFSDNRETIFRVEREEWVTRVQHGKPFSANYGFGLEWMELNLTEIAGNTSPALQVTKKDGENHYMVGPPYLATGRDMYAIAEKWVEFAPKVHKQYSRLLAEMFAYCIAAAHLKLPHKLVKSLMISDYGCPPSEGWSFIDRLTSEKVCSVASNPNHENDPIPNVIHYCQTYTVGEWSFSKRSMKNDFFSCESPLLEDPPANLGEATFILSREGTKLEFEEKHSKREAFMICGIISLLNGAANFFKATSCSEDQTRTNYNKTLRYMVSGNSKE
jgi:hypothetical protein